MWMAALWGQATGAYFPQQDWCFPPGDDGVRPSCWETATTLQAATCAMGLKNMRAYLLCFPGRGVLVLRPAVKPNGKPQIRTQIS